MYSPPPTSRLSILPSRNWVSLRLLLNTIVKTMAQVANFVVLLLLFMYIAALIGMQLFANRFRFDPVTALPLVVTDPAYLQVEPPRHNFDNLLWATVTVFQILTGENWNTVSAPVTGICGPQPMLNFLLQRLRSSGHV